MKKELVQSLTATFEGYAQQTESGVEYWLARDLQHLLGYTEWRNFSSSAVSKAKTACDVSGHRIADHFVDVNKMVLDFGHFVPEKAALLPAPQRDTGNVQSSARDKTHALCLALIRILRDVMADHTEFLPSYSNITEKSMIETATV